MSGVALFKLTLCEDLRRYTRKLARERVQELFNSGGHIRICIIRGLQIVNQEFVDGLVTMMAPMKHL